ncbi:hypothetical protein LshimejAT787_0407050 [Lyophyllum shimeji]|uniref:Transmembrane protein n=1 Tax=Lyophyllum shimeji TaxID=47721 RepID=A0A9P3PLI1_LYOSH|nr:hypothetical protein LshimejAT787_0407050 [Lyophyllum shimeji]
MASFDLKVEDSSPLISYEPSSAWIDTPSDALAASYSGRSLHTTSVQGATATMQFNGTGISIFGGRRSNYGTFTISVDGQTITTGDASSAQDSANQLLGSASGLVDGPHTAVFTNTGGAPIDIDFATLQTQASSSSTKPVQVTYDDSDPSIQYSPSVSAWSQNHDQAFMNGTLHFTSTPGASASITFTGDAVAVYGTVSPDHANVQITLDGRANVLPGGAGGFVSSLHSQVLLYYANNLGLQPHVLTMACVPEEGTGPFMDIDAITVFSSGAPSTNDNPSSAGPSSPSSSVSGSTSGTPAAESIWPSGSTLQASKSGSLAPIIGGAVGGLVGIILLLALVYLFLCRRTRRGGINKFDIHRPAASPKTPDLPMQGESMMEAGFSRVTPGPADPVATYLPPAPPLSQPSSVKRDTMGRHSIAPSYYSDPSYASDASSARSSTALLPDVPSIPSSARLASPGVTSPKGLDPMMNVTGGPRRPSRRPPPLDIE